MITYFRVDYTTLDNAMVFVPKDQIDGCSCLFTYSDRGVDYLLKVISHCKFFQLAF